VVPLAEAPPEPTSADFAHGAPSSSPPSTTEQPAASTDWVNLPIDELRAKAAAEDNLAMEELARRLVQGVGVAKDQQAGAGWLLRAAEHGSAQAAFNVGVMYERGFVVERDSVRAVEWYRKAVQADLPMAKHNLALMLRDGKGAPRDGKEAVDLLRSATRQGMAASMFALGDIYERGDGTSKDPATALAWFAITAEFERQTNRNGESALAKTAMQRVEALRRTLLPGDLERAQQIGQSEFKQIVEALQPPKPPASQAPPEPPAEAAGPPAPAPASEAESEPPGWPKTTPEQIRAIQQALVDLKLLRDKPDGVIGPMTRAAIKSFQKNIGARETGEPTKDVFASLQEAMARRDNENRPPDLGQPEPPPPPPTSADLENSAPKPN
jgi:localization factor PodJL